MKRAFHLAVSIGLLCVVGCKTSQLSGGGAQVATSQNQASKVGANFVQHDTPTMGQSG